MAEKKSIRLAGNDLEHSPHVFAFFNTYGEEYQVLLPLMHETHSTRVATTRKQQCPTIYTAISVRGIYE